MAGGVAGGQAGGVAGGAGGGGAGGPADAGPPRSGLLAVESFDTAAGLLTGRDGGVGFSDAWTGSHEVQAQSVTWARAGRALTTSGGKLRATGGSATRTFDTRNVGPLSDTAGKLGAPGRPLWLTFLAHAPTGISQGQFAGLQLFDDGNELRFIGAPFFEAGVAERLPHWGVDQPGLQTPVYTDVDVRTASLLVVKLEVGVTGEPDAGTQRVGVVSLWVNPGVESEAALGAPDVRLVGPDFRFNRVRVAGFSDFLVDELRLADGFAAALPSSVQASPLAHEPFSVPAGPVYGFGRGLGWRSSWFSPPRNGVSSGTVVASSLAFGAAPAALATAGGALSIVPGSPPPQRRLSAAGLPTALSDTPGKLGSAGRSLWLSALAHVSMASEYSNGRFAGLQLFDGTTEHRFIGAPFYEDNPDGGVSSRLKNWGLDQSGLPLPVYSNSSATTVSLLVVRIDFPAMSTGQARLNLFINPTPGAAAPTTPDVTLDGPDFRFDTVRVNANFPGFIVDELRVGTSFGEVTPVAP
jgi:hypothetical protein